MCVTSISDFSYSSIGRVLLFVCRIMYKSMGLISAKRGGRMGNDKRKKQMQCRQREKVQPSFDGDCSTWNGSLQFVVYDHMFRFLITFAKVTERSSDQR